MLLPIYSVILVMLSVITYALYAGDKKKAKKGKWRTPEATLLGFSFFGGAIGGTFAMFHLRHKTKHWYFKAVNFLGLAWQFALLIYLIINS
jgi:uncharacterized membrane protein YsdA (DUF1294 family)